MLTKSHRFFVTRDFHVLIKCLLVYENVSLSKPYRFTIPPKFKTIDVCATKLWKN